MPVLRSKRLEIRQITPMDYPSAVAVYRNAPGFVVGIEGHAPESIDMKMIEEESREAAGHAALYCGIFLLGSGELIGIATFERSHHAAKADTAWIALLLFAESAQQHGYGTEAYQTIERFIFSDAGVQNIELGVLPNNLSGREFWLKMGYGDIASEGASGEQSVLRMRKSRTKVLW